MVPKFNLAMVDVRDVAKAHINAMTVPEAAGNRHLLSSSNIWMSDMAKVHICKVSEFWSCVLLNFSTTCMSLFHMMLDFYILSIVKLTRYIDSSATDFGG